MRIAIFYGKTGVYVVVYRCKDKNTTQGNLAELVGSPVAPFWIGVFERISGGTLSVCKVTFGAEPKDFEVYDFILKKYYQLRFSPAVATDVKEAGRNPKRVQREVRKQV